MNVLFYSNRCETCRKLLMLLQNDCLLSYFKLICIDDNIDKYPKTMIIPMMMVTNLNKPLVGRETFEWLQQIKFLRQQQGIENNKKIIQQNMSNSKKGPIGYDDDIMAGISDKFAFTKIDDPLPHSYFKLGSEDKQAIFTAPEQSEKLSKNSQSNLIKMLEEKRKTQDEDYMTFMKQKQLEAIENSEKEKIVNQNDYQNNNLNNQMMQQQLMQQQMMQQQMNRKRY